MLSPHVEARAKPGRFLRRIVTMANVSRCRLRRKSRTAGADVRQVLLRVWCPAGLASITRC